MGMKGHPQSNCGGGGGGGGGGSSGGWLMKKKTAIVVVVILVGIMGAMVVQKVRDRRLFNLVIKDKDRQILSLHLLLQKERQYAKENKRKNQDLNAKLYSLGTQKIELNNKLIEMRSTIGSLRDEQRALELAIDEKLNEIKRKESEIKDLRSSLQTPPKIWSVSSDDPSNQQVNLTAKVTTMKRSSRFSESSNAQNSNYQETVVEGNKKFINPNVNVQKPKDTDLGKLASSKEQEIRDLSVDHKDNANGDIQNTTNDKDDRNGLSMKGRRYFIGASESQRDKSERQAVTGATTQSEKSRVKANQEESSTEIMSGKRSIDQETKKEDEDEDEADMNPSTESSNGSEADQDY